MIEAEDPERVGLAAQEALAADEFDRAHGQQHDGRDDAGDVGAERQAARGADAQDEARDSRERRDVRRAAQDAVRFADLFDRVELIVRQRRRRSAANGKRASEWRGRWGGLIFDRDGGAPRLWRFMRRVPLSP